MTKLLGLSAGLLALGGCAINVLSGPPPGDCSTLAVSSVSLTLVDESGLVVQDADVRFAVDGGDLQRCDDFIGTDWVCGWEVAGTLEIVATAPGFAEGSVVVEVQTDECHVITEEVELVLQTLDCTDDARPAVVVDVVDGQGTEIDDATVQWGFAAAGMLPVDCEPLPGNRWACAEEQSGEIEISVADAGPYEPYLGVVTVEHDGCHPITEAHEAVLQFLPD